MKLTFDISATEFVTVRDILADIVPPECRIWVFGSRVKNQVRFNSDLDLALECKDKLPPIILHKLKEAFNDSSLPYRVDVLDINDVSKEFQTIIRQQAITFPLAKSVKVPALRFPEYVGNWSSGRLEEFITRVGKPISVEQSKLYREIGIRSHGKGIFHKDPVAGKTLGNKRVFKVHVPAFVVNIVFAWEHAIAVTTHNEKGFIASHRFPMFVPVEDKSTLPFVKYFFLRKYGKHLLGLASPGGAGRNKTLGQKNFDQLKVVFPTLPEQRKIAAFLSAIDTKIEQLTQKKALFEDYKRGCMQKLFSQELRFKDAQGKAFPDWEDNAFSKFANKVTDSYNSLVSKDDWPCVELESLGQGNGKILQTFRAKELQSIKTKFKAGDVLFGKLRPYLRKYAQPKFDGVCTSEIWVIRANDLLDKFLYFLVQSNRFYQFANIQSGSKMPRSDWKIVSCTVFSIPSLSEQKKISDFLSSLDTKIALVATELEHCQTFKKGLMQQMFV